MMWNKEQETMPREQLERLQSRRLGDLVHRVYKRVPFYKQLFDLHGINPEAVEGIADLPKLPFTNKSNLREQYPFEIFAVPLSEVVRIHASSGTTGTPTVVGYTRRDIETWAELCARSLVAAGARQGQVFHNAYGYGLFTGGLGMHYGAEKLGLVTIPVSGGNTARQLKILQDFGSQIVACTPSYALTLIDAIHELEIPRDQLEVETFILGAEPWTEQMRDEIEQLLDVDAINIYGLSEVIGPGVSCECKEAKDGAHVFEDHFAVEVIDPETEKSLAAGEVGELVFTTLTKEAFPLIRYRTGDLASLDDRPCSCGRTHVRMSRIVGRSDDMLIIRGVNIFPSQIEAALIDIDQLSPHYQIVVGKEERLDVLEIRAELAHELEESEKANLHRQLTVKLKEALGIRAEVLLTSPNVLPRSEGGKLQRVIDQRSM